MGRIPKALAGMLTPRRNSTDEYAVMIDTRDALDPGPAMAGAEWTGYVESWQPKPETPAKSEGAKTERAKKAR